MADIHTPLLIKIPLRSDVRELFKSIIGGAATAIQTIYPYSAVDLKGESPVLRIMSAASERPPLTFKGSKTTFGLLLQTLVLAQDDKNDWTRQNAEDTLDLVEAQIATVIFNPETWRNTPILSVRNEGPSAVREDVVQGQTYIQELTPVRVEVRTDGKQ